MPQTSHPAAACRARVWGCPRAGQAGSALPATCPQPRTPLGLSPAPCPGVRRPPAAHGIGTHGQSVGLARQRTELSVQQPLPGSRCPSLGWHCPLPAVSPGAASCLPPTGLFGWTPDCTDQGAAAVTPGKPLSPPRARPPANGGRWESVAEPRPGEGSGHSPSSYQPFFNRHHGLVVRAVVRSCGFCSPSATD